MTGMTPADEAPFYERQVSALLRASRHVKEACECLFIDDAELKERLSAIYDELLAIAGTQCAQHRRAIAELLWNELREPILLIVGEKHAP